MGCIRMRQRTDCRRTDRPRTANRLASELRLLMSFPWRSSPTASGFPAARGSWRGRSSSSASSSTSWRTPGPRASSAAALTKSSSGRWCGKPYRHYTPALYPQLSGPHLRACSLCSTRLVLTTWHSRFFLMCAVCRRAQGGMTYVSHVPTSRSDIFIAFAGPLAHVRTLGAPPLSKLILRSNASRSLALRSRAPSVRLLTLPLRCPSASSSTSSRTQQRPPTRIGCRI